MIPRRVSRLCDLGIRRSDGSRLRSQHPIVSGQPRGQSSLICQCSRNTACQATFSSGTRSGTMRPARPSVGPCSVGSLTAGRPAVAGVRPCGGQPGSADPAPAGVDRDGHPRQPYRLAVPLPPVGSPRRHTAGIPAEQPPTGERASSLAPATRPGLGPSPWHGPILSRLWLRSPAIPELACNGRDHASDLAI